MSKKTYSVLSALRHDGEAYGPNIEGMDRIKLDDGAARPLLDLKVIGEPETKTEDEIQEPETVDERRDTILAALEKGVVKQIKPTAAQFSKAGIAALIKELGWMPDPEDVDAVLAARNAN